MRKFIEEYGTVILTVLAIVALIFVLGPLGNLISEGVKGNVNSMAGGVNNGLPEGGGGGPTYSYTVKAVSESGKIIDEYLLTYGQGTTNIVKPKEYTGYIKPVSQKIEWNTEDKTIEFVYDLIDYQLLVDLDDGVSESGTVIPTVYTIESDPIRLPSDLKKGSEEFVGYSGTGLTVPSKNVTIPTGSSGNRTYMANYETVEYINVQFDSRGGQTYDPVSIVKGSSLESLPTPSREGYEFVGWFDGYDQVSTSTKFDKNTQLVAKWKAIHMSVNVIHRSSATKNVLKTSTVEYDYGQKVTIKALTFTGYKSPSDYTFTAGLSKDDIILEYTPITYNIAYTLNGGSVSGNPSTYTIESSAITLKNPTKVGSEFLGWTGSNGSTPNKAITIPTGSTGDKSYSANFKLNEYTITYKSNSGTGADIKDTVKYGDNYLVQNNLFTRDGFKFIGWNTQADGNGADWSAKAGTTLKWTYEKNVVLYAQWKEITYELVNGPTFNSALKSIETGNRRIKSIEFVDSVIPTNATQIPNIDNDNDNGVIGWYVTDTDGMLKVYISTQKAEQKVIANSNSSRMFASSSDGKNLDKISYIDVTNLDVSNVTNMYSMFYFTGKNATTFDIGDIGNWDVSNVTNMSWMFGYAGQNATTFDIGNIGKWDVSNVANMSGMFYFAGRYATTWNIGDLSNWDVSNVTDMSGMFRNTGQNATTWSIGDLSNWDVSNVTNMSDMFEYSGKNADTFDIGNIGNWDVSNVTDMSYMFYYTGQDATTFDIGDISNWDVSNVTNMSYMFSSAGQNATTWSIGDLSNWDVSNVTYMNWMFCYAGEKATTFDIGDIGNWDVSNVTNMIQMFYYAGKSATTWSIGDLSNWDVSNVTDMSYMFYFAGQNATTWSIGDLSNWDVSNVTNMSYMFSYAGQNAIDSLNCSLTIMNTETNVFNMYNNAFISMTGQIKVYDNGDDQTKALAQKAAASNTYGKVVYAGTRP